MRSTTRRIAGVSLVIAVGALAAPRGVRATGNTTVRFVIESLPPQNDNPQTRVSVDIERDGAAPRHVALRSVVGECSFSDAVNLRGPRIAEVRCWWAGQGDTFRLVARNGALVVERVELDEGSGEGPGVNAVTSRTRLDVRRADLREVLVRRLGAP